MAKETQQQKVLQIRKDDIRTMAKDIKMIKKGHFVPKSFVIPAKEESVTINPSSVVTAQAKPKIMVTPATPSTAVRPKIATTPATPPAHQETKKEIEKKIEIEKELLDKILEKTSQTKTSEVKKEPVTEQKLKEFKISVSSENNKDDPYREKITIDKTVLNRQEEPKKEVAAPKVETVPKIDIAPNTQVTQTKTVEYPPKPEPVPKPSVSPTTPVTPKITHQEPSYSKQPLFKEIPNAKKKRFLEEIDDWVKES